MSGPSIHYMTDEDPGEIEEHPPEVDIDDYIEDCNFRVERMWERGIWVCAYTHADNEPDHHFDLRVTDDGGLHVSHRTEYPDQ